ncbi:hypothetical protein CHUAL_000274 [Chamberlinius hualienensis]
MEVWQELFGKGELSPSHFRAYWKSAVPRLLSPISGRDGINQPLNESEIKKELFEELEKFLFGSSWQQALEMLKGSENPPIRCGKVFKVGEPTYSCRDCGADPTCVLCVDCFKTSGHQNHRYRMSTSGGGGYCDCGDVEAWRSGAFCDKHRESNQNLENEEDVLSQMPSDIVAKGKIVLESVVSYCYQMILWDLSMVLPEDLRQNKDPSSSDCYVTLLYNDEIHTYEQVIRALMRAINCTQKEAVELATAVDREGRAIIRCRTLRECNSTKETVEKFTAHHIPKPLRVVVMHSDVLAHQTFALRLLVWLLQLINYSRGFRYMFGEIVFKEGGSGGRRSIVESIMAYDTKMWKSARSIWHQLFISGLLMENKSKQQFCRLYARNYSSIVKDFIEDDHEQTLSITSLSVQLFTVPSLAHMLIAEEDIIAILLHTFNIECEGKLNNDGKLAFVRTAPDIAFKRACCILSDLNYLVNTPPEVWTGSLRRNFLHGFSKMLELLNRMQCMDSVTRQVGQHLEFEPEWETAFMLHLRLGAIVTMMIQWCSTDRTVLIKAYRATMKKLAASIGKPSYITRKIGDHSVSCIDYEVASQPVSIHLPLSCLLSGLYLHLEHYDLTYDSPELAWSDKPTPVMLMELPLKTQVMIAQVHAGMWRRNGYSLLNQIFFYRNVRYRSEIYDRDMVALQIGASLIEANDFLIHLLSKFSLIQWVWEDYELAEEQLLSLANGEEDMSVGGAIDSRLTGAKGRQVSLLAEDFLGLVITIVGERYVKGVGQVTAEDCIKKEVIQQLSIEPMTHSQLVKSLPEDSNNETGLEQVIDQIATFKKSPGNNKGLYELLPDAHKHFNPFYYHYNREEQSKAEEFQRKRIKDAVASESSDDLSCLPPPLPPPFSKPFSSIVNILCSDVMLKIMRIVLERVSAAVSNSGVPPTDAEVQRILHLIGYALHEEQRSLEAGNLFFQFTKRATKENILGLLESLVASAAANKQAYEIPHPDLFNWTLRKFRLVKRNHVSLALESGIGEGVKVEGSSSMEVDEPVAVEGEASDEKKRRAELAMARRARIMAQMADMQKTFISTHANLFERTFMVSSGSSGSAMDLTETEEKPNASICLGPSCGYREWSRVMHTCILCQEEEAVSTEGRPLVYSVLVQKSTVLSTVKGNRGPRELPTQPLLPAATLQCSLYASTCGHVMHADCWKKYFDIVATKERRRSIRIRQHISFDVAKQEFLCPLCECLSNAVVPILQPTVSLGNSSKVELSMDAWIETMECVSLSLQKNESARDIKNWPKDAQQIMDLRTFSHDDVTVSTAAMEMVHVFAKTLFTVGFNSNLADEDSRKVPIAIYVCFYTIRVIEMSLRDSGKPTFGELSSRQSDAITALVGFASVCCRSSSASILEGHLKAILSFILNDHNLEDTCLLEVDAFGLLLSLVLIWPATVGRTENIVETAVVRFVYVIHALQIVATAKVKADDEVVDNETNLLVDIYKKLHPGCGSISGAALQKEIEQRSVPFLRCCALFFNNLTGITPPDELFVLQSDQHFDLCFYLSLEPNVDLILRQNPQMKSLTDRWISSPSVVSNYISRSVGPTVEITQLCTLPHDYSELINEASSFTCPSSDGEGSRMPTLCLICGHILCSQSYCCQSELNDTTVGACTFHAHRCGAGVGMFLRVRECKVLLLANKTKGCFIPPPYLDRYGETDQGLRRGNPLYLCRDSYKKLHKMWLNHGIMEEIAHSIESAHYVSAVEWQHL